MKPPKLWQVSLPPAEWITVLKLSTMWRCLDQRARAVRQVLESGISPVEQIQLGRQYFVGSLVLSGFRGLITRKEMITEEEAATIGLIDAFRLMCIRELNVFDKDAEIRKWFKEELELIGANEMEFRRVSRTIAVMRRFFLILSY